MLGGTRLRLEISCQAGLVAAEAALPVLGGNPRSLFHMPVMFLCDDREPWFTHTPSMAASRRRQSGFTFLWLLFLVAGLGVSMAAIGTLWHSAVQREKEAELLFVGDQYRRAIESFMKASPNGAQQLPKSLDELLLDPRFPQTVRHLRRLYPDPITGAAEWGLLKDAAGGISGVHSRSERTPFKTRNFPKAYEEFADKGEYRQWIFTAVMGSGTPGAATVEADKNAADNAGNSASQAHTIPQTAQTGGADDASDASNSQRAICINEWRQAQLMQCEPYQKAKQWTLHQSCLTEAYHRFQECLDGGH